MKKEGIIYLIITLVFIFVSVFILKQTDLSNNVALSKAIEIIIVMFLIRISYGCTLYIKKLFRKNKYSYGIIMNLGLLIFIIINILRHINVLIENWNQLNISDIYNNTLESFSFFAMLTLPCIIILSIYGIITNIILIKKEGFRTQNLFGIFLSLFAIVGLFGAQAIYVVTSNLVASSEAIIVKRTIDILINLLLSYFYTLILATLYCNIKAANHIPKFNKDFVIILGCQIRKDGTLPPLLQARVDKAIDFAKMQKEKSGKDIIFIPSGGQGNNEVMPEAEAMKNYLINQGIEEDRIIVENKSTSTIENLNYSNSIIINSSKDAQICFSTTNYHVFRSGVIAAENGIDCEGMGSKTKWYFYTNALIREFVANLVQEKKRHILLMILMCLSTIILIWIGYYYNLIT